MKAQNKSKQDNVKPNRAKSIHSVWDNYRYVYSNMWKNGKSPFWYGGAEIIFNVIAPLGGVIIPSIVVGLLTKHTKVPEFILSLIIVFSCYGIISGIHSFLVSRNRMQYVDIRCSVFWPKVILKCTYMDYHLFEKEKVREALEKATECLGGNWWGIEGFMHRNVSLFSNILGLITYACIISFIHPVILLLLMLISVLQLIVFNRAKQYEHKKKDEISKINVTQRYFQEQSYDLSGGKDIRLYQLDKLINRVYTAVNRQLKKINSKIRGAYYINDVTGIVLRFLRDGACYGYLIYLLMNGLEVSYFVLYLGIIGGFATWFTKITEDITDISRNHLMICDMRDFLEIEDDFRHNTGIEIVDEDTALDILFDHVSFRYPGADENILEDISFHIRKGERFALVGINGAGKTTIVKLMCGFYRPTAGRILINGINIGELNIEKYFNQIAVVFQDAFTFSFTIGENISGLTNAEVDRKAAEEALEQSGLKDKVDRLEKGMDTYLNKDMDESGIQFSGGQLQKLMLARALYKKAKLLILDEPTAALDAIAENELYEKYQRLLKGRTSLFISHRLASTRFCNHILFLESGRIIEEGTHEALMKRKGSYAKMFEVQSKYYKEDEIDEVQKNLA